jgi:hypothetical protein
MKTSAFSRALLTAAALLTITAAADARDVYGVRGPRGGAVVGEDRAVVATRRGVAATGPNGTAVVRRAPVVVAPRPVVVAPLPRGYIRVVPAGYTRVVYGGYHCYYVGGVYYRTVFYEGETVYVVVK